MNYTIAICDDETAEIESLKQLVCVWSEAAGHTVSIQAFSSAEEFLFEHDGSNLFDLLLLDVEMRSVSGIDLAKQIRKNDRRAEIIFITSHAEFIGEGYEVDALHYLLKPVKKEKLLAVLDRAAMRLSTAPASVIINCGGELVKLMESDIFYVESFLHYLVIHTKTGDYKIKESLSVFGAKLSGQFFRIHRSYLASLHHIIRISRTCIVLEDGTTLPLSRGLYDEVNRAFINQN